MLGGTTLAAFEDVSGCAVFPVNSYYCGLSVANLENDKNE